MKKIVALLAAAALLVVGVVTGSGRVELPTAQPTVQLVAKAETRHTDDGSGWGFCVGAVPPPGWVCY